MNYRHAFHAGNFADLVKHAGLTLLLDALMADSSGLVIVDTHAGAGGYDLDGELSRRTGEAAQGIFRLMEADAPAAFDGLKTAVAGMNPAGGVRFYPGSPRLIGAALRPQDRYTACEVRDDDHALLSQTLAPYPGARAVQADGYETAPAAVPAPPTRALVLIDPPFERPDDYQRIALAMAAVRAKNPRAVVAVWLPLKDLETFDAFLRSIEGVAPDALVGECRLRKLDNPMKMNGCALVIAGAPAGLEGPLSEVCAWVAGLGEGEGRGEAWRLNG